jgi:hypothetical protein
MTNPTSNFGWQMPTSTDLVTDLPADFEVFGQAVDTSMADLKGGTTGQILSKATNADMDFTWITNDVGDITNIAVTSPITGGGSSGSVTIGVNAASTSASGVVQLSDSTSTTSSVLASTPTATKSAYDLANTANTAAGTAQTTANAAIPKSTVTTTGDVIYSTGSAAVTRLGIGTAGQVLTVNSGATAPEWTTIVTSPTFVGCLAKCSASTAFTANTSRSIPFASADVFDTNNFHNPASSNTRITIPTGKSGYYLITGSFFFYSGIEYQIMRFVKNGGSGETLQTMKNLGSNNASMTGSFTAYLAAGDYIEMFGQINSTSTDTLDAQFGVAYLGA